MHISGFASRKYSQVHVAALSRNAEAFGAQQSCPKRSGRAGCTKVYAMQRQHVDYDCDGKHLSGYFAADTADTATTGKPAVLVAHTAIGPQERFITDVVHSLAEQGYAAFALDLFGAGHCVFGDEKAACNDELRAERGVIAKRALAAVDAVCDIEGVDATRVAAIGYCLGGKSVLDLMRNAPSDGRLKGVVSFHGILDGGGESATAATHVPRVLAFHGYKDPFVSDDMLLEFCRDMEGRGADYEVRVLGASVLHAFTRDDKQAPSDAQAGLQYSRVAADRSWRAALAFLREALS